MMAFSITIQSLSPYMTYILISTLDAMIQTHLLTPPSLRREAGLRSYCKARLVTDSERRNTNRRLKSGVLSSSINWCLGIPMAQCGKTILILIQYFHTVDDA